MRSLKEQIENRCVYFNGVQNDACKAEVNYDSFPRGTRPCIKLEHPSIIEPQSCGKKQLPTPEDVAKELAGWKATEDKITKVMPLVARIKKDHKGEWWSGVERCPVCGMALVMSIAAHNGHVWGKCETEGCVSWMESHEKVSTIRLFYFNNSDSIAVIPVGDACFMALRR